MGPLNSASSFNKRSVRTSSLTSSFPCTIARNNQSEVLTHVRAKNGHLAVVKWLHENRTEGCTTDAMDDAASNGHLTVVKWLHENECTLARGKSYKINSNRRMILLWQLDAS